MKLKELNTLGIPAADMKLAGRAVQQAAKAGLSKKEIRQRLRQVAANPAAHGDDPHFGELAKALKGPAPESKPLPAKAPCRMWGTKLDPKSMEQLHDACSLPVAVRGALMPDAHVGYGLPIGGVLATRNAVIPYAVGVDIACRMKMTVLDLPCDMLENQPDRLTKAIQTETRFGVGADFKQKRSHPVMDDDWNVTSVTRQVKDKAWAQLGTSGSGNHFVEFGVLEISAPGLPLEPGRYLALLSHSGSRGAGARVCKQYSDIAKRMHAKLTQRLKHLAWLPLDTEEGQEYWAAMSLMGRYAAANHACIHRHIAAHLGAGVLLDIENHHNFAWKEEHGGETVVVHRKGATPAHAGALGIIPGTMASPAYVVRGRGEADSLHSAAHGAGRVMSRSQAKRTMKWRQAREFLRERGVTLLSAGLDEAPMVYKDIDEVMAAQSGLVDTLARFQPRIVKMAGPGEPPED